MQQFFIRQISFLSIIALVLRCFANKLKRIHNPLQNILRKIKKSSKVKQSRKNLIFVFAFFLTASAKILFLQGRLRKSCVPMQLCDFSDIVYFLRSLLKSVDNSRGNTYIKFKVFCFIGLHESSLKMMKKTFYSIIRALSVLNIFQFLSWLFRSLWENGLIWKLRLILKFMTSQLGQQTITKHILQSPISQEVKTIGLWNLISKQNITWEIFYLKNHAKN